MTSQIITVESVAKHMLAVNRTEILRFMDAKAPQLCRASYSRGEYGRLWIHEIKKVFPRLDLNGASTRIGLTIEGMLEAEGYCYVHGKSATRFAKEGIGMPDDVSE